MAGAASARLRAWAGETGTCSRVVPGALRHQRVTQVSSTEEFQEGCGVLLRRVSHPKCTQWGWRETPSTLQQSRNLPGVPAWGGNPSSTNKELKSPVTLCLWQCQPCSVCSLLKNTHGLLLPRTTNSRIYSKASA